MHIRLLSDLHTEFRPFTVKPTPWDREAVLVLAGDIAVGTNAVPFIEELAEEFAHVIYVLGNHEFYHHDLTEVATAVHRELDEIPNANLLDNETLVLGNVRFLGTTLWTDMDNKNPLSMVTIERSLNDFDLIRNAGKRLMAFDVVDLFDANVEFLEAELAKEHDGPTVVVTHHGPSFKSVHPIYRNSNINGAFMSDLERLMHHFDIRYWLHGHTHQTMHYEIQGTKVRMNPFGYGHTAENLHFDPTMILEVGEGDE